MPPTKCSKTVRENHILRKSCPVCHKLFSGRSHLFRHLREVHFKSNSDIQTQLLLNDKNTYMYKCLEGCDCSFRTNLGLIAHLNCVHGFRITLKYKQFASRSDLNLWFVRLSETGNRIVRDGCAKNCIYYACNRKRKPKTITIEGKSEPEKQCTIQIAANCIYFVKIVEQSDKYIATYCNVHYGHEIEEKFVPVSNGSRSQLATPLELESIKKSNGLAASHFAIKIEIGANDEPQESFLVDESTEKQSV